MSDKLLDYAISYPKSGRTWVRYIYVRYLQELYGFSGANIFEIEEGLTYYYQPVWTHLDCDAQLQRTWHQVGAIDTRLLEGRTCLIMTRNIPDTLLSLYYHTLYRTNLNFHGTLSQFIRNPALGVLKICAFYDIVNNFLPDVCKRIIKVRYEDLHKNTAKKVKGLFELMGLEIDEDKIETVAKEARFDNMKKLAESGKYMSTWMAPADINNPQSAKIRSGKVGEALEVFSREDLEYIDLVKRAVLD